MFAFFRHRKFWLTWLVLAVLALGLEIALRLGIWDPFMHPHSFVSNALKRVKAAETLGEGNIDWISVGNSAFDWGTNHGKVRQSLAEQGKNYLRFGFESGGFMSLQTSTDWAIKHLPRLEGVIVGMPVHYLASFNDPKKTYQVSWPFLSEMDADNYQYFRSIHKPFAWPFKTATGIFGPDLLDFLRHPVQRLTLRKKRPPETIEQILNYNRHMPRALCQYSLDTLKACVATAKQLKKQKKRTGSEQFIVNVCGAAFTQRRLKHKRPMPPLSPTEEAQLTRNWLRFFRHVLARGKQIKLVLMPEHTLMNYAVRSPSAEKVLNNVLTQLQDQPGFQVIDLRDTFRQHPEYRECQLYNDPLHYSNNGKKLFTEALISALQAPD